MQLSSLINGKFSRKGWLIFERKYRYVQIFFSGIDGIKMEVTKVPVYVALKGCEISAQRPFLILNNEVFTLMLLLRSLGREMKAAERKLMLP